MLWRRAGDVGGAEAPLVHAAEAAGRRAFQRASAGPRQAAPARRPPGHRVAVAGQQLCRDLEPVGRAPAIGTGGDNAIGRGRARLQRVRDRQPQAKALEKQEPRICASLRCRAAPRRAPPFTLSFLQLPSDSDAN